MSRQILRALTNKAYIPFLQILIIRKQSAIASSSNYEINNNFYCNLTLTEYTGNFVFTTLPESRGWAAPHNPEFKKRNRNAVRRSNRPAGLMIPEVSKGNVGLFSNKCNSILLLKTHRPVARNPCCDILFLY